MNEVVKYHNDFNKIKMPSFSEQEQNLLFLILSKIKDKGTDNVICLSPQDLQINESLANSRQYLTDIIDSLKTKFFKADFKEIIETRTTYAERIFNLFQQMEIHYTKRNPDDPFDTSKLFERIDLAVNPQFSYLVNELTANFTHFELQEFFNLEGKYIKTLYRLLKQFRNTGKCTIYQHRWQDFCDFMGIPQSFANCDIDKRVLKPAIKELAAERNLFNCTRPIFDNLTYKKIKDPKGRGRGGKVIGIEFYFTPEPDRTEFYESSKDLKALERQNKTESIQQKINVLGQTINHCTPYNGMYFDKTNRFDGGVDKCKIKDIHEAPDGTIVVQGYNIETQKDFKDLMTFESINHMKNSLKPYW